MTAVAIGKDEWLAALDEMQAAPQVVGETIGTLMARWSCTRNTALGRVRKLIAAGRARLVGQRMEDRHWVKVYQLVKKGKV